MGGVVDINVVSQVAVVEDECALWKSRRLIPEHVNVTDPILCPDIESGAVPRCACQRLPPVHVMYPKQIPDIFNSAGLTLPKE